jgi:alkyl sulfatase BDS1-like metallo-beta-lactamase superfamily hydrolase
LGRRLARWLQGQRPAVRLAETLRVLEQARREDELLATDWEQRAATADDATFRQFYAQQAQRLRKQVTEREQEMEALRHAAGDPQTTKDRG